MSPAMLLPSMMQVHPGSRPGRTLGSTPQVNPASRSRSRTISGCSVQMSGNFLPFPEPGAPPHSMLGDDAAPVQNGVAAHETRATGGSRASRREELDLQAGARPEARLLIDNRLSIAGRTHSMPLPPSAAAYQADIQSEGWPAAKSFSRA